MTLVLVTRPALDHTNDRFRAAAQTRGREVVTLFPGAALGSGLPAGRRLIYRVAVDAQARLLEALVCRPGDACLHDPFFVYAHQTACLAQAGLPVPREVYFPADDHELLARQVDWLGGFPVVCKAPGTEGGKGVSRHTDLTGLASALGSASGASLQRFVPHAHCWRLTVLNGDVLAATRSMPADGDFRSNGPGARFLGPSAPPPEATRIACAAVAALRLSFGGVDLMETPDGDLILAEVNFPCYFGDQQDATGIDIAGAIIDRLAAMERVT